MNIWDSVHRGLEKASQEAARISKAQKARSQMERLGKQIATQEQTLLDRTIALYEAGQLQQNELISLCQELISSRQQFVQTQSELQALQNQASQQSTTIQANPADLSMVVLPPSTYPSSVERTMPANVPPPPPGNDPATAYAYPTQEVFQDQAPTPSVPPPPPGFYTSQAIASPTGAFNNAVQRHCSQCGTNAQPDDLFCQNCGAPLNSDSSHVQPTSRADAVGTYDTGRALTDKQENIHFGNEGSDVANQPTVRPTSGSSLDEQATVRATIDSSIDTQATVRANISQTPKEDQKSS